MSSSQILVKYTSWLGANRPQNGTPHEQSWQDFCDKMRKLGERGIMHPWSRKKKDEAEVRFPCFAFGTFRNNYHNLESFVEANCIGLDFDGGVNTAAEIEAELIDIGAPYFLYTTKSHSPDRHSLRAFIPLSRNVTAEEHNKIQRELDARFGKTTDPHAKDAVRLWWEPTKPHKAPFEWLGARWDEPPLDVDAWLERARERERAEKVALAIRSEVQQAVPTESPVTDKLRARASKMLLNQCTRVAMAPQGEREGTLRSAAATMGGKVDFVRALGREHILAELVRAAEHAGLTRGEALDKASRSLDWGGTKPLPDRPYERAEKESLNFADRGDNGVPKGTIRNTTEAFARGRAFAGSLAWDEFADCAMLVRELPGIGRELPVPRPLADEDVHAMRLQCNVLYGFEPAKDVAFDTAYAVARERPVHPVRDWLRSLEWDGRARLGELLPRYFGVPVEAVGPNCRERLEHAARVLMIGAVARVERPGCRVDTVVVLHGPQGFRKSTSMGALAGPEWFLDAHLDLKNKDTPMLLRGKWICELAELSAIRGRDVETVRAFISRPVDNYRAPYARIVREQPRQIVFVGTSNDLHPFGDRMGNRRFVSVLVRHHGMPDALARDRAQLWAEAYHWYQKGVPWWFSAEEEQQMAEHQAQFAAPSGDETWLALVEAFLANPTRERVTARDLLTQCLLIEAGKVSRNDEMRISQIMNEIDGWERFRQNNSSGQVRGWRRVK